MGTGPSGLLLNFDLLCLNLLGLRLEKLALAQPVVKQTEKQNHFVPPEFCIGITFSQLY